MDYPEKEKVRAFTGAARAAGEKLALTAFSTPPVDPAALAKLREIEVVYLGLPDNVSGRGDLDEQEIYINSHTHPNRQRFTLAHELGHFVLGHKRRQWEDFLNETSGVPMEQEADAFASGLLMPKALLKTFKDLPPKKLAQLFKVSEAAMWVALDTNNLI